MRYKKFTSYSEEVHKRFVCKEFHLDFRTYGVDFLLDDTAIEMKGKKRYRKTVTFVCSANQVKAWEELHDPKNLLWMFLLYDLSCKVTTIRSVAEIERRVLNREFWILPWKFIKQFRIHDYPSWGPHYHFTTKDFPPGLETRVVNGVTYHTAKHPKIEELFDRREFLS